MIYFLSFIVVLGILIFVHEFGHFIVARKLGVGVTKFSFGFGPKLAGFRRGETEYLLSAVPLGGYVKLVGESEGEEVPPEQLSRSFQQKPVWVKMAIVAAGPLANLVFAILVFWVVLRQEGGPPLITHGVGVIGAAMLIMGDVGALPLGAALAVVALMTGQWILLPVIAVIPLSEMISVIVQVGYFRLTHGKRLFKMAPLHHHFELLGWSETQVVQRFWLIGLLAAIIGAAIAIG